MGPRLLGVLAAAVAIVRLAALSLPSLSASKKVLEPFGGSTTGIVLTAAVMLGLAFTWHIDQSRKSDERRRRELSKEADARRGQQAIHARQPTKVTLKAGINLPAFGISRRCVPVAGSGSTRKPR